VPPTVKLANQSFGERDAPIVFGWVLVGHQIGAATAAFGAGVIREHAGTYAPAFVLAGIFAMASSHTTIAAGTGAHGHFCLTRSGHGGPF
jgi:hypothetical protein